MKKITIISLILILSLQGFSQTLDDIAGKIAKDSIDKFSKTLDSVIIDTFTLKAIGIKSVDTLDVPIGKTITFALHLIAKNPSTEEAASAYKEVTITRRANGNVFIDWGVDYQVIRSNYFLMNKLSWSVVIQNNLPVLVMQEIIANRIVKCTISKEIILISQ